jgi:hypothetical protein
MISSEVQRTLVKSPPELWAELSDPESLARHLGEFGEIRITHVKPEQKVEWEADDASGTVVIKPSGWGTKVRLTVTRELAERDATRIAAADEPRDATELVDDELESNADDAAIVGAAPEPPPESDPRAEPHVASEPHEEPETPAEAEAHEEAEAHAEAEPAAQPEAEPRRGFFARLFGRRRARAEEPSCDVPAEPAPAPSASEPIDDEQLSDALTMQERDFEPVDKPADAHEHETAPSATANELSETVVQTPGGLAPQREKQAAEQALDGGEDAAGESAEQIAPDEPSTTHTKLAEELAAEEVTAVLTGVLDRLGAAHHRPFSRA